MGKNILKLVATGPRDISIEYTNHRLDVRRKLESRKRLVLEMLDRMKNTKLI